ncbi:MAG: ChuX/HutX family heme-like substrate-binding protein [Anaerolineales bacterium]
MVLEQTLLALAGLNEIERAAAIRETFDRDRKQMVLLLARQLGVPEGDVVRAMPDELVDELDFSQWLEIMRAFESLGEVHVIVSNGATTLECAGQFGKFSTSQGFFNVQTKSLDMHIRSQALASVFAVRKPSHTDGKEALSFQFFDNQGNAAFKAS